MKKRYVVIGAGIAGITAAETIRSLDQDGEIMIFSKEKELPYSRPMLSKSPLLSLGLKSFALHDEEWYREQNIDLRLGVSVDKLDVEEQNILAGGRSISYDKCIIATGASNFIPPFKGREEVDICDIRKISDLKHLRRLAFPGGKAVVIGGGVIGLEMAAEIRRYGMDVTVLEAMPRLMPRLIDERTSDLLTKRLPFEVFTGVNILKLSRKGEETVIEDDLGRSWNCDLLIVSCGVRADLSLALDAGIACNRAIVVNQKMETSAKNVYACGDCAEFEGFNAALWSEGLAQGEVAGRNAAGEESIYTGCDTSLVMMMDDLGLFSMGDLGQTGEGYVIEEREWQPGPRLLIDPRRPEKEGFSRKIFKDGKLVGAVLIGDLTSMNEIKEEILGR